ncbi:hypothetical protein JCM16358_22600 [Halanaerocella petrolearia]
MKLLAESIMTTTELMMELFDMDVRMVHNLSEKMRYKKIYNYLVDAGAERIGTKEGVSNTYTVFNFNDELYLIPEFIFDEHDTEWVAELNVEEESQQVISR